MAVAYPMFQSLIMKLILRVIIITLSIMMIMIMLIILEKWPYALSLRGLPRRRF